MTELLRRDQATPKEEHAAAASRLAPAAPILPSAKIDKTQLTIAEPKRLRDKAHLKFVASQPCLVCGRQPSDPHHLRFATGGQSVLRLVMSSPCRSAVGIIDRCIKLATRRRGGRTCRSMLLRSLEVFGSKAILRPLRMKPLPAQSQCDGDRQMSAIGGKADIVWPSRDVRF